MAHKFLSDDALRSAKLRAMWPDENGPLSDAELLDVLSEELLSDIAPVVEKAREDYYVQSFDYPITAGQELYRIPPRAMAASTMDVLYVDVDGKEYSIPYRGAENAVYPLDVDGSPGFFFRNDKVGIFPVPATTRGSLRIRFYLRPAALVLASEVATITVIGAADSGGPGQRRLTFDNVPATFTTSTLCDIVRSDGMFNRTHLDLTLFDVMLGVSGTVDIEESELTSADLQVGDYLCLADESPVAQLPDVFHSLLKQRLVSIMHQALKKTESQAVSETKVGLLEKRLAGHIQGRVRDEPKIMVPRTAPLVNADSSRRTWGRG